MRLRHQCLSDVKSWLISDVLYAYFKILKISPQFLMLFLAWPLSISQKVFHNIQTGIYIQGVSLES